jgi:hypothetical protein
LPLADSPGCAVAMSAREVASSILGRTRRLLFLCAPFLSASIPPPPFAIMQPFIGRVPVSVRFAPDLPRCLAPPMVGLILGHSRVGHRFVEVLTAEYEGRLLTTDVECEVVLSPDSVVVLGSNGCSRGVKPGGPSWVHHRFLNVSRRRVSYRSPSSFHVGPKRMTRFEFEFACKMRAIWLEPLLLCRF